MKRVLMGGTGLGDKCREGDRKCNDATEMRYFSQRESDVRTEEERGQRDGEISACNLKKKGFVFVLTI